jgi:hypothetical protein
MAMLKWTTLYTDWTQCILYGYKASLSG